MLARTWALGLVCSLVGIAAGLTVGCSSSAKPTPSVDTHADDPESDAGSKVVSGNTDDEPDVAADAGTPQGTVAKCVPSAIDDPDDNFTDSNCDGIDGDKNKAIFVATTGSDTADGSLGTPVATLGKAMALAIANSKDVYACAGDYTENIAINAVGLRVYGGYDCKHNWVRNSSSQAHLASQSGSAL